jgi:predicted  nucleic acid-binding Zn-ribbon protein
VNEIEALKEELEELRGELRELKTRVRELEEEVPADLNDRLTDLEGGDK